MLQATCWRIAAGQQIFLHYWNYCGGGEFVGSFFLISESNCACTTSALLPAEVISCCQKLNVLKHICELLISSNITKLPIFSLDKLSIWLIQPIFSQSWLAGFFFFSCLNLLQRRHKIRFWHTIMILAVLEPEARYVPVRDLVQPSVFDRV